jgi:hypothetical protein
MAALFRKRAFCALVWAKRKPHRKTFAKTLKNLTKNADRPAMARWNVFRKLLVAGPGLALAALLFGCGAKGGGLGSNLHMSFPSASRLPSSSAVSGFSWANACFIANVVAQDIPTTSPGGACAIPLGIFSGSVAPGGSIDLSVPNGTQRTVFIYVYSRASPSQACPALTGGFGALSLGNIVEVGKSAQFDTTTPSVTVDVTLTAPAAPTDIVAQMGLPATCRPALPAPPVGSGGSRVILGSALQQGASGGTIYQIQGTASAQKNELNLIGGAYQLKLTRQAQ